MISYPLKMGTIAGNLEIVTQRIISACVKSGRLEEDVRLVCVTKEVGPGEIEEVLGLGVRDIGENRVPDASIKYKVIGDRAVWHMVGHLQTNKVKDAVRIFSLIHSVDSARLARAIDRESERIGKVQDVLIQVNTSGESTKFGIGPDEVAGLFKDISLCQNINIKGLMTIAPEVDDPETVRPYFRKLRELRDTINSIPYTPYPIPELSMGMTGDLEVAIEEGATMIRVGRAIFKD